MPRSARSALTLYTIPPTHAFADSLARGLIERFGDEPLALARGRLLLPNNRAVRAVTEAFVRESGAGLLLPRLIPIGDPELDERIGGALESSDDELLPPAIDPQQRLFALAAIVGRGGKGAAESLRLAADLARTLDALQIEQISPSRLADAAAEAGDLAHHWERSLAELSAITQHWPLMLAEKGAIDLVERRNLLLARLAERWCSDPPPGFTIAAGITTAAPAVAQLLSRVARMPGGEVVLPGLWLAKTFPDEEWRALGPDDEGRVEPAHPQFHLKLLLDKIGANRADVRLWPGKAGAESAPQRAMAVTNALAAPAFSHKWEVLKPRERRLSGVRLAQFPDAAAEAQGIALAMREALETPGKTVALVTPDRMLAARVSALLERWSIEADDSAGQPLSQAAAGSFVLAIAAAATEELAPVALLAALKHPLAGGVEGARLAWLDRVRRLDLGLRGPRPAPGVSGIDRHFAVSDKARYLDDWHGIRPVALTLDDWFARPLTLGDFARRIADAASSLGGDRAWAGQDGRAVAELLAEVQEQELMIAAEDAVPVLRQLLDQRALRPPFGKHPRVFIWGLLEARLQRADLMIAGGLNEGVWPALPAPDPWLPPRVRAKLGMPTLEGRIGLSAHDFASVLGAPEVLVTRARRDNRSPTVASRLWLRLRAIDPDLQLDEELPRLALALDAPATIAPAGRPAPAPPAETRPDVISVTDVDRLKADPFAFYAKAILRLRALDPLDIDPTAAWKGTAVHDVLERWFKEDRCDPAALIPRAEAMLRDEALHPLIRTLWQPRLMEAIDWITSQIEADRDAGHLPLAAEIAGEALVCGVTLKGKADRIDRNAATGAIGIVDYKTGQAPSLKSVEAGFALQLGLLGLIAEAGGFAGIAGPVEAFEYWSFAGGGKRVVANKNLDDFLAHSRAIFADLASRYLSGSEPFVAKLHPAYEPYGDYDQLMRLEEWYGRQ